VSADFVPGLELSRGFYGDAVRPILDARFPGLPHAAALIGSGSEVLGYDTRMSQDHDWGPRLLLFLPEAAFGDLAAPIFGALRRQLPPEFAGFPVERPAIGVPEGEPYGRRTRILTPRAYFQDYLGFDIGDAIEPEDWLTFPEQNLLSIASGQVYYDGIDLRAIRERLAYYPRDVWLYLMAAAWTRIGQEEHLMGRAGSVGDEIGSALIGARLVRDLMRLCFLMERRYAPYPKWFGTAFAELRCARYLRAPLLAALHSLTWQEREEHLVTAYEQVASLHNALGLTAPLPVRAAPFFGRPFRVIHLGGEFAGALAAEIVDPQVKRLTSARLIGGVDQFSDSTDLLEDTPRRAVLRGLYDRGREEGNGPVRR
jgi:hypothetical protein